VRQHRGEPGLIRVELKFVVADRVFYSRRHIRRPPRQGEGRSALIQPTCVAIRHRSPSTRRVVKMRFLYFPFQQRYSRHQNSTFVPNLVSCLKNLLPSRENLMPLRVHLLLVCISLLVVPTGMYAQAGAALTSGAVLPGVTVEAKSPVLIEQ